MRLKDLRRTATTGDAAGIAPSSQEGSIRHKRHGSHWSRVFPSHVCIDSSHQVLRTLENASIESTIL